MKQITTDELLSKDRLDKVQSQKAAALFKYRTAYKTYSIPQDWPVPQAIPLLLDDLTAHVDAAGQATGFPAFLSQSNVTMMLNFVRSLIDYATS